ncbi:MAG TPA: DUF1844 domain-containing protein [Gemmatimonadales bacterium]|nr:DUF1844 domain-containing protein [Gemmatimonadales bacterium]
MDQHFASLVLGIATQAGQALDGTLPGLPAGTSPRDAARALIDTLAMLEAKTAGHLDDQERQLLSQALTALRFRFVQTEMKQ